MKKQTCKDFNFIAKKMKGFNAEIIEQNGEVYCLSDWNGEFFGEVWQYDSDLEPISLNIKAKPILKGIGELNEDGEYDQYETIRYDFE